MTCSLHQPTSRRSNVVTSRRLTQQEIFLDITKRTKKEKMWGGMGYKTEKTTQEDSRDHVILILVFSFSNSY